MCDLRNSTKEELIAQINILRAHNTQLRNIISKTESLKRPQRKHQKPFDFEKCNFHHVLLKFLYLGWDYHGYVMQEDTMNTIEHHIFEALKKTCLIKDRTTSNYHRCGRTDKGVSSFSQVISLDVRTKGAPELDYCKILNRVLPHNIQFVAWCPVDDAFSARFNCKNRTYKYFFPKTNLDIKQMTKASDYLVGTHDFRNFCKMDVNNGVVEYFRTIVSVSINENDNSINVLTIKGNAFLWHQIRCIVGILILVGLRKEEPEIILELLDVAQNSRKPDYYMASEIPLNLYDCQYDNIDWVYSKEALNAVIKNLGNFWTFNAIKTAMVQSMLTDLSKETDDTNKCPSEDLIQGVKSRNYIPVMKRQLCESLEDRVAQHLLKKKK